MTAYNKPACFLILLLASALGQISQNDRMNKGLAKPPLDAKVQRFDITDAILRDGLSELSLKNVDGLHLGFEEVLRDKLQDDPQNEGGHFTSHLENATVRQVLEALCESDRRYIWSEDGASINVYPRAKIDDPEYLLNLQIDEITFTKIPDPDQALTPLSKQFPRQQIGYIQMGGDNTYAEPWTVTFKHLTVRQFINRIAEHMGSRTSWIWQGGGNSRMFTFLKGGFHTSHKNDQQ